MLETSSIVATIPPVCMRDAIRALPPAGIAAAEIFRGETVNRDGKRVSIQFRRYQYQSHNHAYWGWRLEAAEFLDQVTVLMPTGG